ncbi:MAG: hypothetical protein AAFX01_08615 [Cyanobacteria bacterium J06638_28]
MGFLSGILSALVAALVSVTVALISYISSRNELKSQRELLTRSQQREMTLRLYEQRIAVYPEAIQTTDGLRRSRLAAQGNALSPDYFQDILDRLDEWHGERAFLLLSEDAVHTFYALRRILREPPAAEGNYTPEQLERIKDAKDKFRYALRLDIQLLYREENT